MKMKYAVVRKLFFFLFIGKRDNLSNFESCKYTSHGFVIAMLYYIILSYL